MGAEAARAQQWDMCELLLQHKANPLAADCNGRSPLADVIRTNRGSDIANRMLQTCTPEALKMDRSVLMEAMRVSDTTLLQRCLGKDDRQQAGTFVDGWPILWWVAYFGQTSLACTWIKNHPDVARWEDGSKRVLLHWIGVWGCASELENGMPPMSDLVKPLADAHSKGEKAHKGVGEPDSDGFTPLTLAVRS